MTEVYDHPVRTLAGEPTTLAPHRGKVLLIVNTASKCGFTPQYEGLEALWKKHRDAGLVVLGFPCNQFGAQEPGSAIEIADFCERNYGVTFPMFEKIEVNGPGTHPLFRQLKSEAPGILGTEAIKWNFTKFLVDRRGRVLHRFAPNDAPKTIEAEIERVLRS